jgi:hypothetical protein
MLFWALLASGQINMRKVDGWQTFATRTSISQLTSPPDRITSCRWRLRHIEFQHNARRHPHAPSCPLCKETKKVRTLLPGRKADDFAYRCEECGEEIIRSVPRVWGSVMTVPLYERSKTARRVAGRAF